MSSLPGLDLEDYLMWNFDLIVGENDNANPSLRIAEILGVETGRVRITPEQFAPLVHLYEPHRDMVERRLAQFDEDRQSWRDYAGYAFDFLDELDAKAIPLAVKLRAGASSAPTPSPTPAPASP